MMGTSTLYTNFRLRAFTSEQEDIETLHRWLNDSTSWSDSDTLNYTSPQYAEAFIIDSVCSILERGRLSLMIEAETPYSTLGHKQRIGYAQLMDYDPIGRKVEAGIYLDERYRGLGYIKQIMPLVEHYAWSKLDCRMIYMSILASNEVSIKVFERLGYTQVACLPEWKYVDGRYVDLYYYIKWNTHRSTPL